MNLMNAKYLLFSVILANLVGCASLPMATDLSEVMDDPHQFRNRRIEITAPVVENPPPQGDAYRTWTFIVGSSGTYRIVVSEQGFNPSTIEKAYRLVEEARRAGDEVTLTGRLRVGPYREIESGIEVELDSVRYRGTEIRTDKGPFVRHYRYYYPYYYDGPPMWHYGYFPYYDHHYYWY